MRTLSLLVHYAAGMLAGYGTWGDHDHFWLWIVAAFFVCVGGRAISDLAGD